MKLTVKDKEFLMNKLITDDNETKFLIIKRLQRTIDDENLTNNKRW